MAVERDLKATKFIFIIILILIAVFMYITYKSGEDLIPSFSEDSIGSANKLRSLQKFERSLEQEMDYEVYKNFVIQYSKDGVRCFNEKKELQWEKTFSINRPIFKAKGDFFGIADLGGDYLYLFNAKGNIYEKKLDMKIENFQINSQGKAAVLGKKDEGPEKVQVLNEAGQEVVTRVYEASAVMTIALSEDGKYLATANIQTDHSKLSSRVGFFEIYNEKSKQYHNDNIISGSAEYDGIIVDIHFTKKNDLIVLGDHFLTILSDKAKEKMKTEMGNKILTQDIHGPSLAAVVTEGDSDLQSNYMIKLFHTNAARASAHPIEIQEAPKGMLVSKEGIIVYTNRKLYNISNKGTLRWEQNMFMDIEEVRNISKNRYLIISREQAILMGR